MSADLDYLDHLVRESQRFLDALSDAPSDEPVPTCPDWTADDLLWHLAEVQWFWGTIVREGLTGDEAQERKPVRPAQRAALKEFFARSSSDLVTVLTVTPPATHAWTWSVEQTVGFVRRRQAHEALIHRIDAELTAGSRTAMDPQLSADGVDEALRIMYGGTPPWGTFTPDADTSLRLRSTDTGHSWLVTLGRFTGTDPDSGTSYDEPDLHADDVDAGADAVATVSGTAEDLDCWLWHRPTRAPLAQSGDPVVLERLEATLAQGIN